MLQTLLERILATVIAVTLMAAVALGFQVANSSSNTVSYENHRIEYTNFDGDPWQCDILSGLSDGKLVTSQALACGPGAP